MSCLCVRPEGDVSRKKSKAAKKLFLIVTDVQAGSSEDLLALLRCDPMAVTRQVPQSHPQPGSASAQRRDAALIFTAKRADDADIEVLRLPDNFSCGLLYFPILEGVVQILDMVAG